MESYKFSLPKADLEPEQYKTLHSFYSKTEETQKKQKTKVATEPTAVTAQI